MKSIGFRYAPLSGGNRQGYTNNDTEAFKGQEQDDNNTRELIQNALDAPNQDSSNPVKVVFELRQIETNKFEVFDQYSRCLDGCKKYWGQYMDDKLSRFIEGAESTLKKRTIPLMVISDYNTTGLTGSRSQEISSPWEALTNSDGFNYKNSDDSAGSNGIGKNAPFACSSLSLVFYNTYGKDNESAFIGVSRLATLYDSNNEPTQRVGKYQVNDEENKQWTPIYPENKNSFRDLFHRTDYGTDVIIAGFIEPTDWIKTYSKSIIKNFFVAIIEKKLIVELKDEHNQIHIDAESLPKIISSYNNDPEMVATIQLYNAFTSPDLTETTKILESDDVEVYIKIDKNYKRTIANFRSTGMLLGTYYKRIIQHYAAVVIVRGHELGALLKDTEPPKHNMWDYKRIPPSQSDKRKHAKNCIKQIGDFVLQLLKNQFEIPQEEQIDAAGVGEYLPDEDAGITNQPNGEDILKPIIKIAHVKTNSAEQKQNSQNGKKGKGIEQAGKVHNHTRNPNPIPHPNPPKPIIPQPDNPNNTQGVQHGHGTKHITMPNISTIRAFPVNSSQGLYKIVFVPTDNYDHLYVECFAVREDSKTDPIFLESVEYNEQSINCSEGKAGPLSVNSDTPAILYARFAAKEKMELSINLTEEEEK